MNAASAVRRALDLSQRILTARATFLVFAGGVLLFNLAGSLVLRGTEGKDFWEHIAAMRAFSENLWDPPNPYLASESPTHLLTPYHWFWGAVSSASGVHPLLLVPLIGTVNLALFLVGVEVVARRIFGDRKWALLVGMALLLLWWNPWNWSGFHAFGLLPLTSSYPYWFALAISLLVVATYPATHVVSLVVSIAAVGLVFVIHPITAIFLVLSMALKGMLSGDRPLPRRIGLTALPLLGVGLALLWPYFPVPEAISAHGRFQETGFSGHYRTFYRGALLVLLPAFPGAIYVARRAWRRDLDFIAWGAILFLLLYAVNFWTLRSGPVARVVAFVALFLQLGAVMLVKETAGPSRRVVLGTVLVLVVVAGIGEAWDARRWIRLEPWTSGSTTLESYDRYRPYDRFLGRDDVVLSDPVTSWALPPIAGTNVVAVLHANPFLEDHDRRLRDVERFWGSDRQGMLEIMKRYGVTHVLLPSQALGYLAPIREEVRVVYRDDSDVLVRYLA